MMSHRKQMSGSARLVIVLLLFALVLGVAGGFFIKWQYDSVRYPLEYETDIMTFSEKYDLPPAFVAAVINSESSFNPMAHSDADAIGLMQIQPETFDWAKARLKEQRKLTKQDLFDPHINIEYGCAIYRLLMDEFHDPSTAAAAYHAGWGNVKSWLKDPAYSDDGIHLKTTPFGDTNHYTDRILHDQKQYEKRYEQLRREPA